MRLLVVVLFLMGPSAAKAGDSHEYAVKAAYIYNFARFIEWPSESLPKPDSPIVIGIVGADPFGNLMDQAVRGKTVESHPFIVKRLSMDQDLTQCHILFVCASEKDRISRLPGLLKGAPVLTVGDIPHFAEHGGIIGFYMDQSTVRFEINLDAAKRARLSISSRLLGLARIVKD